MNLIFENQINKQTNKKEEEEEEEEEESISKGSYYINYFTTLILFKWDFPSQTLSLKKNY